MKEEYKELYDKITDPRVFEQDKWYKMPSDGLIKNFIESYKESGCLEFTLNKSHFRVTAYPCSEIKRLKEAPDFGKILSSISKSTPFNVSQKIDESVVYPPDLPGYCARPDIVEKILAKENKKVDRSKQIAAEEFRKQKEEFFSQKPKSVFDDF